MGLKKSRYSDFIIRCLVWMSKNRMLNRFPDEAYLKIIFYLKIGSKLRLDNPVTFNEKLQWLKIYDRRPDYTNMADKLEAKKYVAAKLGEEYVIPTFGVWNRFDEIDFNALPDQFVLKCTHDSGGYVICADKKRLDISAARKKIEARLKCNFYYSYREWPYKDIKPRIIAEQYLIDGEAQSSGPDQRLNDYKILCFNGKAKCSFVCSNRNVTTGLNVNFYDRDWNPMPFERHYPKNPVEIAKPQSYAKMLELAESLAEGIIFLRVDFYQIGERVYFGELTFYPGSGFEEFSPESWDKTLGDWIRLPKKQRGELNPPCH